MGNRLARLNHSAFYNDLLFISAIEVGADVIFLRSRRQQLVTAPMASPRLAWRMALFTFGQRNLFQKWQERRHAGIGAGRYSNRTKLADATPSKTKQRQTDPAER